jgi:hypothetical protein
MAAAEIYTGALITVLARVYRRHGMERASQLHWRKSQDIYEPPYLASWSAL